MDYTQSAIRAIVLASKHTKPTHRTSAGIALQDAVACRQSNRQEDACNRALTSLRYSVGIGHEDYKKALCLTPRK